VQLGPSELQLLKYLYDHRGTDYGECNDINPFRVIQDLQLSDRSFRESVERCTLLGLVHTDGIPISPFAERIANVRLTIKGRELLWLLENAGATEMASKTSWQNVMNEIDALLDRFLSR